jgi:hypothetical protein
MTNLLRLNLGNSKCIYLDGNMLTIHCIWEFSQLKQLQKLSIGLYTK